MSAEQQGYKEQAQDYASKLAWLRGFCWGIADLLDVGRTKAPEDMENTMATAAQRLREAAPFKDSVPEFCPGHEDARCRSACTLDYVVLNDKVQPKIHNPDCFRW